MKRNVMSTKVQQSTFVAAKSTSRSAKWRDYFQMTKPTISLLVVATVVPSMFMAAEGGLPSLAKLVWTLLGTFLASGSAGMFNHLVDSDIDAHMQRTMARPIPAGQVSRPIAAGLATSLGIMSFVLLYFQASPLAAYTALFANFFYVVVYTMYLKRRTVQNIVIGGAAGAVGPLIGWSAMTNEFSWSAWALFAVIFLWTPPHFWALAIKYRDDYAKAKIPMLPSVRGLPETRRQILLYSISLLIPVLSLSVGGAAGWVYTVSCSLLTLYFIWLAFRLWSRKLESDAMPLFIYSCFYLFGIFGCLAVDQIWF